MEFLFLAELSFAIRGNADKRETDNGDEACLVAGGHVLFRTRRQLVTSRSTRMMPIRRAEKELLTTTSGVPALPNFPALWSECDI